MATQFLENHQKLLGKSPKHVVTDVVTRWNSVYFMLERLSLLHGDIVAGLHDQSIKKHKHLDLKDNHWVLVDQLVSALKPLVSATEVLCSEEFPTSSGVYPLVFALVDNHLIAKDLDSNIVCDMKTRISAGLSSRLFPDGFLVSPTMIASALDPCYKNLKFLKPEQRTEVQAAVVRLITEIDSSAETVTTPTVVKEEPHSQSQSSEPSPKKFKFSESGDAMSFLLSDIIEISDDYEFENKRDVTKEYSDFLGAQTRVKERPTLKSLSLSWWRENDIHYPRVAKLAQRYLSIPGTSVPSERAFSAAGLTITRQRAALSSETADAIIFLNKNTGKPLLDANTPSTSTLNIKTEKHEYETPAPTPAETTTAPLSLSLITSQLCLFFLTSERSDGVDVSGVHCFTSSNFNVLTV
ncbi:E3 SUMO-protein ligase ZBED1-like [Haliotis asinina]|uniref:E3 SUMO-protein ligase ZBED1-like n=1 Tax=Haliotis asinina TaxID=109174 RepID=UPI003532693E